MDHGNNTGSPSSGKPGASAGVARIMSLQEACKYIGVAAPTMYKYLKEGSIPGFKLPKSRVWKFDKETLDTWLSDQQRVEETRP